MYQNDHWNVAINSRYIQSGQKVISFGQKRHRKKKIREKNVFLFVFKTKKNVFLCFGL